ncbi:hypothetical protein B0J11DRAFT_252449 [Dendryphion nanum]|uniref:Apple domain-containing protein n=1 Tax=Dendryphion nanum TaxID=256645 RepID=A0A9P9IPR0_9PLEO|nr:hypothetical protein B0J11DRAFT_252449 [Dendryphion nanum]
MILKLCPCSHPTSTMYCPIPSAGMECGWDTNTIAPIEQGEDWSIEHYYNPEECQQVCLERDACRAYRIDGSAQRGWNCEIFNVGLGANGTNLISPTPNGKQWWDRNCQKHIPAPCRGVRAPAPTPTPHIQPVPTAKRNLPNEVRAIPTPAVAPRAENGLSKRDVPLPDYLSDLEYFWSKIYVEPACSCLINSALPKTVKTTTTTYTKWIATTTSSTTYEDIFTVTTTPRQTTVYNSIK